MVTTIPRTTLTYNTMDSIEAFVIFRKYAYQRGVFRACYAFQTQRHAEAHLRRADELFVKRGRRPLPSYSHEIFSARIEDPERVDVLNFIPAIAIMKSDSFLFQGSADWYNMRLFHDERAAMATFNQNYTEQKFRMLQVALSL